MALLEEVEKILEGIDRTEIDSTEEIEGWWETSTGAEFGEAILVKIRKVFQGYQIKKINREDQ